MRAWSVRRVTIVSGLCRSFIAVVAVFLAFAGSQAHAVERIGNAIQIVQTVTGEIQANFRYLILQDPVFQDEVIATKPGSASRIVFRDNTELQVGPEARVTLDNFVFDPDPSVARFVISAFDGIFRFATGKLAKTAYQIETPTAVIGVRGTTFASIFGPAGEQVILLEDGIAVTVQDRIGGPLRTLSQPGLSVTVRTDGSVSDPAPPPEWALEKLRELNALLVTLDVLIRGDDLDDDPPAPPPPAPLPPVQEAAAPPPPPVVVAPPAPAPKPAPKRKVHHKPYPKPEHKPRQRALVRAHAVAAAPAHHHGLPRAKSRADIHAAGDRTHGKHRSDIRIERRGRQVREHIERDNGNHKHRGGHRLEARTAKQAKAEHDPRHNRRQYEARAGQSKHRTAHRGRNDHATHGRNDREHHERAERSNRRENTGRSNRHENARHSNRRENTGRSSRSREHETVSTKNNDRRDRGNRGHNRGNRDRNNGHDKAGANSGNNHAGHDRGGRDRADHDRGHQSANHDRGNRGRAERDRNNRGHDHGGRNRGGRRR